MKTLAIRTALILLCSLLGTQHAIANSDGVAGRTGASTCAACHSALGTALLPSTGDVIFPANVSGSEFVAGKAYALSFVNTGVPAATGAGFNLGDSLALSEFSADAAGTSSVQNTGAEIAHANADNFSWFFNWEANETTTNGQFQWCTLRVNGNGLTSADGPGNCSTKSFSVVANAAPSANAGADQNTSEGATVSLDGTASSDEFPDLTYQWAQVSGPAVTFSDSTSATPTFTAPEVGIGGGTVVLSLTVTEVDHDELSDSDTIVVNISNINQTPIANAGADQSVAESTTVTLDGSATTDPDAGDALTYAWNQTSGLSVTLSSSSAVSPTFTAPATSIGGAVLSFELTITDIGLESSSDSVTVTVLNDNEPPVAVAGADQAADEGTVVLMNGGSSTDESPGSLSFAWAQLDGPAINIQNAATPTPSFTAPEVGFDGANAVTIQLTVTDNFGLSTTDTLIVNVTNVNLSPSANAGSDQTVGENIQVTLNGSGSTDVDVAVDDVLSYAWSQTAGITVSLSSASAESPTFQSPGVGASGGTSTFLLTVTDRGGLQSTDSVLVSYTDGNVSPVADAGPNETANEGSTVTLDGSASTDDVPATISYSWSQVSGPAVVLNGATTATPFFAAPDVGFDDSNVVTLSLTVTDEESLTSSDTTAVTISNLNQPPVANAGADQTIGENVQVNLTAAASSDPDLAIDDALSYSWIQTGGISVALGAATSAAPTFQSPNVGVGGGSATFTLTVTDRGNLTDADTVTVSFTDGNETPVANAGSNQSVNEGVSVLLNGTASTDDVPGTLQYAWSQTSGPSVTISGANTAMPTFVAPEVGFDGANTVALTLTVTDEESLVSSDSVLVSVTNVNLSPVADAGADRTLDENVLVTLNGSASTDPDIAVDDALTFAWTQTGGTAVTLTSPDTANPTFQSPGVPASGGSSTFLLTVTDRGSLQSADSVVISYTDGNTAPVAVAGSSQSVTEGTTVTLDGSGSTDDTPATLEFAWSQVSGPTVVLDAATTATASFVAPDIGFDGNNTVSLQLAVTDEEGLTDTSTVAIGITNQNQAPTANAGSDQTVGEDVQVTLNGSASSDPDLVVDDVLTYSWTQTGGISVSLNAANTATPSFQSPSVGASGGSSTFSLTVTDRGSLQSSDSVEITFSDGNLSPVADAGADRTVNESTAVTLDGTASSDEVQATLQYAWSQVGGPAVVLSGANTATPSFTAPEVGFDAPVSLVFSLLLTDEEALSASDTVTIAITNVNQQPIANAGPDQNVSQASEVFLDGTASSDPDTAVDDLLTFAWVQISGPAVTLNGANSTSPTFLSPTVSGTGQSVGFELTVTDRAGVTAADTVLITLSEQPNRAPIASAGDEVEVVEQMTVQLDGSASSDTDGTIVEYLWMQIAGPAVNLSQPDTAITNFVAPDVPATGAVLQFQLTVTDDDDGSTTAFVNINVRDTEGMLPPVAAILPSSRSAVVLGEVGAFATMLNPSDIPLRNCGISPVTSVAADFSFYTTDPATNGIVGGLDMPIDISGQAAQTYALFFTPSNTFSPTTIEFAFECDNAPPTQTVNGVNTLLLSSATTQPADVIALVATPSQDGSVRVPGNNGAAAFSAASVNVGAEADITATVELSSLDLNLVVSICETNPLTGACLTDPATATSTTMETDATATYSVFVGANGDVAFDPANTRIKVVFTENGVVRGSTSVAVTTQ